MKLFQCSEMSFVSDVAAKYSAYWLVLVSRMPWHCGMNLAELPRTISADCAWFFCAVVAVGENIMSHSASICFS